MVILSTLSSQVRTVRRSGASQLLMTVVQWRCLIGTMVYLSLMVGLTGFEPAATRPPAACSTKLSYNPLDEDPEVSERQSGFLVASVGEAVVPPCPLLAVPFAFDPACFDEAFEVGVDAPGGQAGGFHDVVAVDGSVGGEDGVEDLDLVGVEYHVGQRTYDRPGESNRVRCIGGLVCRYPLG